MIHIITKIDGLTDDEIWNNLEKGKYGATPVHYLGFEQLKKNKAVVAEKRKKSVDQIDYENLLDKTQENSEDGSWSLTGRRVK